MLKTKIFKALSLCVAITLMLSMLSCSASNSVAFSPDVSLISIDNPTEKVTFEVVKKITLKTEGNDVIADIRNVLYRDDRFYLLDNRQNTIWQFDKNGKFKNKLAAIGPGPGEYVSIRNFDVTDEGLLYVLDSHGRKISAYDVENFSFKFSIPLDYVPLDFGVINKDNIFIGKAITDINKYTKLAKIGKDNTRIDPIFTYKYNGEPNLANLNYTRLYRSDDAIIYYDRFTDAIYKLDSDSIRQVFSIQSSYLPTSEQIEDRIAKKIRNDIKEVESASDYSIKNRTIWDILDIYITPTWIHMAPMGRHLFINQETGEVAKTILAKGFGTKFSRTRIGAMGVCEDYFITVQRPEDEDGDYSLILFKPITY